MMASCCGVHGGSGVPAGAARRREAAPLSIARAAAPTPSRRVVGPAGHDQARRRRSAARCRGRGRARPAAGASRAAAFCRGVAALGSPRAGRARSPASSGVTVNSRDLAAVQRHHLVLAGQRSISSSPWPCTTQARSVPSRASVSAIGRSQAGAKTPVSWRLHPGRIGQRAQQVEDRAGAQLDPRAGGVAQRGVVPRREQEDACRPRPGRASSRSIGTSMLTPSAASTSAAPDFDDSARLPCLATGTPAPATHEGGRGGDVERAGAVAAGAARCRSPRPAPRSRSIRARMARTAPVDLRHRLAADPHGHQQAGDLRRRRLAGHDDAEGGLGLALAPGARRRRAGPGPASSVVHAGAPGAGLRSSRERWRGSSAAGRGRARRRCSRGGTARRRSAGRGGRMPMTQAVLGPGGRLERVAAGRPLDDQAW